MRSIETDVLVVGCGPAGLTAASLLARYGVRVIAVSRYPGTANSPRAHITNSRTLEVFRDLGIEEEIRAVGYPLAWLHNNVVMTSFEGRELARWPSYGSAPHRLSDYAVASPDGGINCPQHVMEPVLLAAATDLGADVRLSTQLLSLEQTQDSVCARLQDRVTNEEYEVVSKYLIGADGARSTVAAQLGFAFTGEAGLHGMASSWLEVDLTEHAQHRPGVVFKISQPGNESWFGSATWINVKPWTEWLLMHPWEAQEPPSQEEVLRRAKATIGTDDLDIAVKARSTWQVNNVVASEYRQGRVFLAGDAAHRHPPAGGLGTNTSVQDAFNLAWKLKFVIAGMAGDELLDSYHAERRPVGAQVVDRAIRSWDATSALIEAIGLSTEQGTEAGWKSLEELRAPTEAGAERRQKLAKAVQMQSYRSNALGVELGQHYISDAVVNESPAFLAPSRDPELYYEPTTRPGAYLPHAWIERDRERISTLDLVGNGQFTLLTGLGGDAWARAAHAASARTGVDIVVRCIGPESGYCDVVGQWADAREVEDAGAILVRPDRFVAWRAFGAVERPEEELTAVLRTILAVREAGNLE